MCEYVRCAAAAGLQLVLREQDVYLVEHGLREQQPVHFTRLLQRQSRPLLRSHMHEHHAVRRGDGCLPGRRRNVGALLNRCRRKRHPSLHLSRGCGASRHNRRRHP
jgi:hypothetical protein